MIFKFRRWTAFMAGIGLILGIYLFAKLSSLVGRSETLGIIDYHREYMEGNGKTGSREDYYVISFKVEKDSIMFHEQTYLHHENGEIVNLMYKRNDPAEAFVYSFQEYWLFDGFWCVLPMLMMGSLVLGSVKRNEILVVQPFSFVFRIVKKT